ncbi:MAG: NADH-quinone oxidoreductase subunit G [Xanthomonadaceae bacterium]|nr:NADH-quinone oxidoreductase subunit G [Xanthomonadaceae bacterium]
MSAQPSNPTSVPDLVNIEIDGRPLKAPKGSMIIQAADIAGIAIPRFCYHRKLPIAANCRQCLVEVEMGGKPIPKPQPACATPVAEGMRVQTRSEKALHWQRDVMEFLLINHPLDCPICDQGGECELQDLSLGYGRSVSRYTERKRVVADEDLGPLIATDMTRCIQCTRCVRFVSEIAGTHELGGMGRGEHLEIGTYIGKTVGSELSGNIIDVCPVGALTNKVFRFKARAWELIARPSLGDHDALGSNLWLHTRNGAVLRTVPRDNEAINECWLSDRDRYSHEGLYAADRAQQPMVKRDGAWHATGWDEALGVVVERLRGVAGSDIGALVQPATSCEEGLLLARLLAGLGSAHLDCRLRALDPSDAGGGRVFELPVAAIATVRAALLVGCDLRRELPLLNHRLRQACVRGATVFAVNPARFDFNYALAGEDAVAPQALVAALLGYARAAMELTGVAPAAALASEVSAATVSDAARAAVHALRDAASAVVILGDAASQHPQSAWLRELARYIARATGAACNEIPAGANAVGLGRVGVRPGPEGLAAAAQLAQPRKAYVLYGAEVPEDFADGAQALRALHQAEVVIAFSAFSSEALRGVADVILPIGLTPEIDATLVNLDGLPQSVPAGARLPGSARPGWRVLRALGGLLGSAGFEFTTLDELRAALAPLLAVEPPPAVSPTLPARGAAPALARLATVGIYRGDGVLRRSPALNAHPLNHAPTVRLHPAEIAARGLVAGAPVRIGDIALPLLADAAVPRATAWIEAGHAVTATLPPYGAALTLDKA